MSRIDVAALKGQAAGRWPEVLSALGGVPADVLDGKNHPCPKCGGKDRFRMIDVAAGALLCNQCFNQNNGDGIAALQWLRGGTFPETANALAEYLGQSSDQPSSRPAHNGKPRIVATYDYWDEQGTLLYQVVRFDPKDFRQRRPKDGGGWEYSVKGIRLVPYRLREMLAADPSGNVLIVEGEKDADRAASMGMVATTCAMGAGKWRPEYNEHFRGRSVVIIPDNDKPGREHANQVAQALSGIASSIKVVKLPGVPEKGDLSDWLDRGGTKEKLKRLIDAAPEWTPTETPEPGPILTCLADVEPRPVSWLWPGRIPLGRITLLVGRPGEGKSFLTTDAAARITTGTPWPDGKPCPKGSVVLISAEDDPADTIRPRLDAHLADARHVHLLSAVRRIDGDGQHERLITLADVDAIEAALMRLPDSKLIVVDPIGSFLGGGTDAHRDNEVRGVLAPIAAMAEKRGPAVLVVAHRRKSAAGMADDLALGSRAFTGIARAVWHLTRDNDNKVRRLLLPGKNNLAREGDGLAFSIINEPPRISWERDPVAMSADDALARENGMAGEHSAIDEAKDWLREALADGPKPSSELKGDAKRDGIAWRTVERAKTQLGVSNRPDGFGGPWVWALPDTSDSASLRQEFPQSANNETLADTGETVADSEDSGPEAEWGEL
ncbi:MAG: AAA family ATPase [Pirellulaceae bacterium]|nr:AAA family ATPase [Pirellulaceae bacterium]